MYICISPTEAAGGAGGGGKQNRYVCYYYYYYHSDSLRGSSVKIGTIQRRLAWPLRKDDTHKSRKLLLLLSLVL